MKSRTKRIISTLAICGALVLEAGATAFKSFGRHVLETNAEDVVAYTLTGVHQSTGTADGSAKITSATASDYFSTGSSYVDSVTTHENVYSGKTAMGGLKLGGSSAQGKLGFNFSTTGAVNATKIEVECAPYANSSDADGTKKVNIKVNGATSGEGYLQGTLSSTQEEYKTYTIEFSTATKLSSFYIEAGASSKNRFYIRNIVVYKSGSTPPPTSSYTVTYDGNGNTGGSVPTDSTSYSSGASVTVKGNTGSLVKTGYTFAGWNTQADGKGTDRAAGGTFNITSNTTLYAKWTQDSPTPTGGSYKKVTSSSGLVNGQYLIVCEDQNICLKDAQDAAGNVASVSISNLEISSTEALTSCEFTFDSSKGSFLGTNNKYFGRSSNANGMETSDNALINTVSITDSGNADIVGSGGAYLRCNPNSGNQWFRYYKSSSYTGQKAVQLYKYESGSSATIVSIEVKTAPSKTTYYEGETFNPAGLVITATYDDKTTADIAYAGNEGDFTFSPSGALTTTDESITITYKEKTATQLISVETNTLQSIELGGEVKGTVNQNWDLSGVTLIGHYEHTDSPIASGFTPATTTAKPTKGGEYTVTVTTTYGGKSASKDYTVTVVHSGLTEDDALTVSEALTIIDGFKKATSTTNNGQDVFVKGSVTGGISISSSGASTGAATFTMSDGSKSIKAYSLWKEDAVNKVKFTSGDINVGDQVLVHGYLIDYYASSTHTAEVGFATGSLAWAKIITNKHTVTTSLTGATANITSGSEFNFDNAFSATLTASTGYNLPSTISMTLGGNPFTSFSYNSTTGAISISANTITMSDGALVITATGTKKTYTIAATLDNGMTLSNDATSVEYNDSYTATIQNIPDHYKDPTVTVTMGGVSQTGAYDSSTKTISIEHVTGNVSINATTSEYEVTSVSVSPEAVKLGPTGTETFTATVLPEALADRSVTWDANPVLTGDLGAADFTITKSGNTATVTISNSCKHNGTITLTATANGNGGSGKTASFVVTVESFNFEGLSVTGTPVSPQYVGHDFNYSGLTFTEVYTPTKLDAPTVSGSEITWDALVAGQKPTGTYNGKTVTIEGVTVLEDVLDSIQIDGDLSVKRYPSNGSWDFTGLSVSGLKASGDAATITQADVEYTVDKTIEECFEGTITSVTITASYGGVTATKVITEIEVYEYKLTKIEITSEPSDTSYIIGEDFSADGLVVKATYSDGNTVPEFTGYTVDSSAINKFEKGTYNVAVKADGVTDVIFQVTYDVKETQEGYDYWEKVTSNQEDWSGNYLLVYENSSTEAYVWSGVDGTKCYATATIAKNKIASKPTGAVELKIDKMTGGYSIQVVGGTNNGTYTSGTSGSNTINFNSSAVVNSISYNTDYVKIQANTYFTFNTDSSQMRFRYMKSDSGNVQLYKHVEQEAVTADLIKLNATCTKTFNEDDSLEITDLTITGLYNDGNTKSVTGVTFNDGTSKMTLAGGDNTVTIKLGDITETITVYATPKVPVSSVAIGNKPANDKLYYYGEFADEHQFSATVLPDDAADKTVTWSITSGETLATIDQTGKVTLTGAGAGQVTVQAKAGEKTDTYTFSVVLDTVSSITVTNAPDQVEYYDGEIIDLAGVEVTATMTSGETHVFKYDDGAPITCTQEKAAFGDTSIIVEFDNKQATTEISVHEPYVTKISANTTAISIGYGTDLKDSTLVITATYEDGTSTPVTEYEIDESFDNTDYSDPQDVEITFGGQTVTISVTVLEPKINSLDVVETYVEVPYGEDLKNYITVKITTEDDATPREYSGYDISLDFDNTDKSQIQDVRISAGEGVYDNLNVKIVDSVTIETVDSVSGPTTVDYGTSISASDFTVNVTYTDGLPGTITPTSIDGYDPEVVGSQSVTLYYGDTVLSTETVTVEPSEVIDHLEIISSKDEVAYNGTLTTDDFTVKAVYTDGHYDEEASHPDSVTGFDSSIRGTQTVTLTYKGVTVDTEVKVLDSTVVQSVEVTSCPDNLTYGSTLSYTDIVLSVTYTDGRTVDNLNPDSISGYTGAPGDNTVHFVIGNYEDDITVTVLPSTVIGSITASTEKTEVAYDGEFTAADVSVTYVYTDGHTLTGQAAESISGFDKTHVGEQTITVTAQGKTTTITVTVLPSTVVDSITASTEKTEVAYDGSFTVADVSVTYVYTDGHTLTGQAAETISGFNPKEVGAQTVTVTAAGKETTITVTVLPSTVVDSITASTEKTEVQYGGTFTAADVSVTYVYTDGHILADQAAESISGFDPTKVGEQTVTVTAAGKETTITVTVSPSKVVESIEASTAKTEIEYGGTFSIEDVSVVATYTDGHTDSIAVDSISDIDTTQVGEHTITVSAGGKEDTITITVKASEVIDHIVATTEKTTVDYGSTFTKDDVKVTYVYTDGHEVSDQAADSISGFSSTTIGEQTITVTAAGKETTIKITVNGHVVTSLEVTDFSEYVDQGKTYNFDGKVTAHYADGTSEEVTGYTVSELNTEDHGPQTLKVSYDGASAEVTINVIQTETPVEPYQTTAIIGGAVVGVVIICAGIFFFLKKFKL